MRALPRTTLGLLLLAGCGASSERPPVVEPAPAPAATAPSPVVDAGAAPAPVASATPTTPVAAPPRAAPSTFTMLFDGACAKPHLGHLGARPVFVFQKSASWFDDSGPRELFRDKDGTMQGFLGAVGGVDAEHAWVERLTPARGDGFDGKIVFAAKGWKRGLFGGGESLDMFDAEAPLEQPDGSIWAFATEKYHDDAATKSHFVAWSPSGDPLKVHLPGQDMRDARRLGTGELVAGSRTQKRQVVLRRWSPVHPVTDLVAKTGTAVYEPVEMRIGDNRVILTTEAQPGKWVFYTYDGTALTALDASVSTRDAGAWHLDRNDDFHVVVGNEVVTHRRDGRVERQAAPEKGALANDPMHVWWIGKSGTLYARTENGWSKVDLPASPWAGATRSSFQIEYVTTVGGETVVGTRRVEPGEGKKKALILRATYSSVAHGAPARCGAPGKPGELIRP